MRTRNITRLFTRLIAAVAVSSALAGCWWDGKDTPPGTGTTSYTVGGTVTGLNGSISLTNNGGDSRTLSANGSFTFATALSSGSAYTVAISAQPTNQNCVLANASGSIANSNVTNVTVTCTQLYTVGGSISGLDGSIVLANNGGNALTVSTNGAFAFTSSLADGAAYAVTIATQPTNQTCTLAYPNGNIASANVSNVAITCDTFQATASIGASGGTVSGPDGVQVVIPPGALDQVITVGIARNTAGAPTPFLQKLEASGNTYEVTPHDTQFSKPVLIRFPVASGTSAANFAVSSFDLGWMREPAYINGSYAEIERNTFSWFTLVAACAPSGNDPYPCSYPRGHAFVTATPAGSVTMNSGLGALALPSYGSGSGSAGSWAVNASQVTTLHFSMFFNGAPDCQTGNVTLRRMRPGTTSQLIVSQGTTANSNGDGNITLNLTPAQLGLSGNGTYNFFYRYECTRPEYSNSPGYTAGGGDTISLNVSQNGVQGFTIGGTITGLGSASGLELRNGVRDSLAIQPGSTDFAFGTSVVSGLPYSVAVLKQPTGAVCTVQNGNGTVAADVSNITITCVPVTPPPTGGLVLVPNTGTNNISIYRRNSVNGSLTSLGTTNAGTYPFSIVVTPNGKFSYVSSLANNGLLAFAVDNALGTLTPVPLGSRATTNPYGVAMDPLGRFVWVANYSAHTVSAFTIDQTTGALSPAGTNPTGVFPYAVAVHPSGDFVYVVNDAGNGTLSMFSVGSTGALTSIGTLPSVTSNAHSITVTPNAKFAYALNTSSISRFTINSSTGVLTSTGFTTGVGSSASAHGITVHPNNNFLFVSTQNSVLVYSIDGTTGNLTLVGTPTSTGSGTSGLALDPTGSFLYVVNQINRTTSIFSVGSLSGSLNLIGSIATGRDPQGIAVTP